MTSDAGDGARRTKARSPALGMTPRIIAIANQKGGVGKTTTTVNLATALAASGKRILLIDLDAQGNASTGLGVERHDGVAGTYALLLGEPLATVARPCVVPNLFVVPADAGLVGSELELAGLPDRSIRLRQALAGHDFDMVLIDCPPSLGLININGLAAADSVLVPLQCEFFALEGITQLMRTLDHVRESLNPGLRLEGILLTMFDRRNNLSELVGADVRAFFGQRVFDTVIPRNVRVSEAPSHGKPVLIYDFKSPGAQAYLRLAQEMMQRDRMEKAA